MRSYAVIVMRALAGLIVAASAGLLLPDPALASTTDDWTVSYRGTGTVVSVGPDGETDSAEMDLTVVLTCTVEGCTFYEPWAEGDVAVTADGTATTSWPETGDVCEGPWEGEGSATLEVTATAATLHRVIAGSGWRPCSGGRSAIYSSETTVVAAWVAGDTCVFTGEVCAVAARATPQPAATSDAAPAVSVDAGEGDAGEAPIGTSELASGGPAAPSVLSALATPADAGTAPQQLGLAALLTVILVLLVAFPTALLNSAVETGSDRIDAWRSARRGRSDAVAELDTSRGGGGGVPSSARPAVGKWWSAAAGVATAGLISGFVDPQFGFNAGSLRVLLSILVSFAIDVALGWVLVIWLVRKVAPTVTHSFVFRPVTLLVVVAAVVFTRLTGFEPGIVFGLVAGVAFGALVGRGQQAKAVLATLGYAFGVALLSWVLYGVMGGGTAAGGSFWQTFVLETLAAIAIGGMAALPVALFPLRGMAGYTIWQWNRWVWAGCYAVGLFAFFIVLMPMPFSWLGVSLDLWAWIAIYLTYAAGAVLAWLVIARPWRRGDADSDADPAPTGAPETLVDSGGPRDGA